MKLLGVAENLNRTGGILLAAACLVLISFGNVLAHPLGNFTINHFVRLEVGAEKIKLHYVIDMAEIPTFQELQLITGNGVGSTSKGELHAYSARVTARYAEGLLLVVDGARLPLQLLATDANLLTGAGGLQTMRIASDFEAAIPLSTPATVRRLRFEDQNYPDRIGWRELVVSPFAGNSVFDSSAYGTSVTDELKAYPGDMLATPLDERAADLSFIRGVIPVSSRALLARNGRPLAAPARDRLAELIAVPELTVGVALFGLLIAVLLGGLHALSPGHGKTVVGAYLVGTRGNARHAAFLGLTVTITHTAGVFALGVVTLLASQYVVPERLFPILSLLSGAIVLTIGGSLLIRRIRSAIGEHSHARAFEDHTRSHDEYTHEHDHEHLADPTKQHSHSGVTHLHGGVAHSHLPPGADGSPVTWRRLLALGISGGILPCPSALVVLLAAMSLHRVGYGLLLVVAFSAGLAGVLTAVGLAFVYAGRLLKSTGGFGRVGQVLPVFSALVITCAGLAICYSALDQAGLNLFARGVTLAHEFAALGTNGAPLQRLSSLGMLGLGLVFGLKHATEVDHIVAVSAIVSEQRKLFRAALVGGLWGAGHTASLIVVGIIVLGLRISIPDSVAAWLEFGVALMIISLGVIAIMRALRSRTGIHVHQHVHDAALHRHIHFHEQGHEDGAPAPHSHEVKRIGLKPLVVGAMHGLAGSAALTLLVLTQIDSVVLGILYLAVFGLGSILGMLLMSGLMGLPFALSSRRLSKLHYVFQTLAGGLSIAFGIWYAYATGFASGLLRFID
jgi:ABC-type nickel/cobalt efflux system permease component RcnA